MQNESLTQAKVYLSTLSIDTTNAYKILPSYIDSLSYVKYQIDTYKLEHGTKASPVQLRMYDSHGTFIYGWTQCFGPIERLGLLDSIPLKQLDRLPVNKSLSFQTDLNLFSISEAKRAEHLQNLMKYDYTIIVFWAQWTGWYSKNLLKNIRKYIHKHGDKKIQLLTLNISH